MAYKVLNNAFSTLAGSINGVVTSLTVNTGHGDRFPVIAGADYTYVTLENVAGNIEIVKVTARATTSDVLTIVRGQDGTTARNWSAGDIVELRMVAALMDIALAHVDDTSGAHLASAITNTPAGSIAATTVQAAITELDSDISALNSSLSASITAHLNDTIDAHDASAISYAGGTGMSATDVEAAIDELATEKLDKSGGTATGNISVPDEVYGVSWGTSTQVPTKNAIRDKIESITKFAEFSARASANQSVTSATPAKVTFGTEIFDSNNNFATSTFTAADAGFYQFNGGVRCQATNMTNAAIFFYKNGAAYRQGGTLNIAAISTVQHLTISDTIFLNAGDTVELWASVTGTTPIVEFSSATSGAWFSGQLPRSY